MASRQNVFVKPIYIKKATVIEDKQ